MRKAYFDQDKFLAMIEIPNENVRVRIDHKGNVITFPIEIDVTDNEAKFIKENKNEVMLDIANNKIIKLTKEEKSPNI